eukprot:gnl/MRDRNA2_/MRDRNA2_20171_c0_seq1.p1 gnl/MRDRNA2_/MRDRNA2_20171_c0~~gnl/MRDRNA2_/MRDRNA2_20171_c0_seq1.p1  ORF type:complete len:129 (+),score=0.04 gnl/MRDRNA2_/MRDRNA2_20171_c0_seq1:123-509(+)
MLTLSYCSMIAFLYDHTYGFVPPPMNCSDFPANECPGCCRSKEQACETGCGRNIPCKMTCRQLQLPCKASCPKPTSNTTTPAYSSTSLSTEWSDHSAGDMDGVIHNGRKHGRLVLEFPENKSHRTVYI